MMLGCLPVFGLMPWARDSVTQDSSSTATTTGRRVCKKTRLVMAMALSFAAGTVVLSLRERTTVSATRVDFGASGTPVSLCPRRGSGQDFFDQFAMYVRQTVVPALEEKRQTRMVNAQAVQHGGVQVMD